MTAFALTFDSLHRALMHVSQADAVVVLRCLKESAIADQSFEAASMFREAERQLAAGKSGINSLRPGTRNQKPGTRRKRGANPA